MARTIKKYANRRLYDTQASRHVTLEGIRQLVAGGEDVVVVDDTNGRDITRNILLQVLAEQEHGERPVLTTATLRHIIRAYGQPHQAALSSSLERSAGANAGTGPGAEPSPAGHPATARPHEGGPVLPPPGSREDRG